VSRAEEKLGSTPILGDAVAGARQRARVQFNIAAINEALEPLGARVQGAGQGAVDEAHQLVSNAYERAANMVPGIRLDQVALQEIRTLRNMLRSATQDTANNFERFFRNTFQRRLGGAAGFETRNFKDLDSRIGKRIANTEDRELQDVFRELQRILRAQAGRESPAYADALRIADSSFARLVRVEEAAKRAVLQEGVFSPGQLVGAVRSADNSARGNATARGRALMQQLAMAGQNVLGNVVPNSGTVDRGLLAALAAAPFYPGVAASLGLGSLLYTAPMQRGINTLMRQMPNYTGAAVPAYGGVLGGQR
jgi:hypothetical protein